MTLWLLKMPSQNFLMLLVAESDVGEEECVDNNLVKILKLKFRRDSKSEFWPKYRGF